MADEQRVICAFETLQESGKGVRFMIDWHGQPLSAFAIRYRGVAHAFLNQCGHVPVELDWQEGNFFDADGVYLICATHGALYSPQDGHCINGRCSGKGLTGLPVAGSTRRSSGFNRPGRNCPMGANCLIVATRPAFTGFVPSS